MVERYLLNNLLDTLEVNFNAIENKISVALNSQSIKEVAMPTRNDWPGEFEVDEGRRLSIRCTKGVDVIRFDVIENGQRLLSYRESQGAISFIARATMAVSLLMTGAALLAGLLYSSNHSPAFFVIMAISLVYSLLLFYAAFNLKDEIKSSWMNMVLGLLWTNVLFTLLSSVITNGSLGTIGTIVFLIKLALVVYATKRRNCVGILRAMSRIDSTKN